MPVQIDWDTEKSSITEPVKVQWDTPEKTKVLWGDKDGRIDFSGDEFSKKSNLMKFLDMAGRPGQFIKSLLNENEVIRQERIAKGETPELSLMDVEKIGIDMSRKLKAGWRGLHGKERHEANELWKQVGVEGVPLLGFATELLTDPLMYGGYGLITKGAGLTAKAGVKGASMIPGVTKVTEA